VALADDLLECGVRIGRLRLEPRDDLELAAPQARRDLQAVQAGPGGLGRAQRLGDLGLRDAVQPQRSLLVRRRRRDRRPQRLRCDRRRPHLLQLPRRPRQHDDRRAPVRSGRRHDQPRCRAHRLEDRRARGHDRLLAVRRADRVRVEPRPAAHVALEDRADPPLERVVEDHLAALEAPDDLGGQVVGRRAEPAARDDHVDPTRGEEHERALHVLRPVADDERVGVVDAELAQAVGEERPVAVRDPAGQHLGAGDDDPRAGAHVPQLGRLAGGSGRTRPGGVTS
jgi:hypothetical protein